MMIHGLCIVKNEADVIEESMRAAAEWCDRIYVFDNGSTDGTWELIHRFAEQCPQIIAYKQDATVFSDGLRADIFNEFKQNCQEGDWWCRLDADEFYIDDPRIFLRKVPKNQHVIWTASFSYYFTEQDAAAHAKDPARYMATPVRERLRYYVNHWSEPRFFRHSHSIKWERDQGGWPSAILKFKVYPVRIWVKHFAYRSPEQIESRLLSRKAAIDAGTSFGHEAIDNWSEAVSSVRMTRSGFSSPAPQFSGTIWQDRVVTSTSLDFDELDLRLVVNEDLMPKIPRPRLFEYRELIPPPIRRWVRKLRQIYQSMRYSGPTLQ